MLSSNDSVCPPAAMSMTQPPRAMSLMPALLSLADDHALRQLLQRELLQARRCGAEPALLLIAVQSLHRLGRLAVSPVQHSAVLQAMGERLRARVRSHDLVAQVGSDCFAVILQNMAQAKPEQVQQRLQVQLSGSYEVHQQGLTLSLRMASAQSERQRLGAEELLALARGGLQGERQKVAQLIFGEQRLS